MIIFILIIIAMGIAYITVPGVNCCINNIPWVLVYGVQDLIKYIKHKEWGCAPYGQIRCYIAQDSQSFGCGKTLSATKYIVDLYNTYNGKLVWNDKKKKFVKQNIHVLSNVEFNSIPYERLESLQQFVQETNEDNLLLDDENDTLTVTYMFIDEASSQLNSREFKSNFNPLFISRLLTTRHVRASIILTSQRSGMIDKLMREVTNIYIGCKKIWRFQFNYIFDAYAVECNQSTAGIRPIRVACKFVRDSDFSAYDTYSSVKTLLKDVKEGKVYSEEQILALQGNQDIIQQEKNHQGKKRRFGRRR